MITRRIAIFLTLLCVACKPDAPKPAKPAAGPQVRATVVTIRTTIEPAKTAHTHTLVIAGDRARDTGERDAWRLYDTKANTVTFVDDVARTIRTEPLPAILARRRTATAASVAPYYPRVKLVATAEKKPLHGATAEQHVLESGKYKRELWLAEHPAIPGGLFAMMHASDALSSPLAPMMRAADEALLAARGFPLTDHTEVPLADGKMVVDRSVVSIAQQQVPEGVLALPKGYKDLTPKPPAPTKKSGR